MKIVLGTMTFSDQVDETTAIDMLRMFRATPHREVDTAYVYNKGKTEILLGRLNESYALQGIALAGKANPSVGNGLSPESVSMQLNESLTRVKQDAFDMFYLHSPDLNTPISDTLACVDEHYRNGRFGRFGLSNYAAWQVAEIVELCKHHGWVQPTVYQGMYNALTRDVERELLPCLAHYKMSFYAYNPLAGGMLSGKYDSVDSQPSSGRFASFNGYQERYWKPDMFSVVQSFAKACKACDIAPASAALRWLVHHSAIAQPNNHAIILGSSTVAHLEQNLIACEAGPLPDSILQSLDKGWDKVQPVCIKYFRP
ncbi:MAG: aflatoxin B1 aldehyde reductase [bacterium]|jgi:aflatoxin B1 aldehyde reductase